MHVGVGEKEQVAARLRRPRVQGVVFAEPARRQVGDMDDVQLWVGRAHTLQNRTSRVGRAVVQGDNFKIWVVLRQNGLEGGPDGVRLVEGGDDDGDLRVGCGLVGRGLESGCF